MRTYLAETYSSETATTAAVERLRAACRNASRPRRRVQILQVLEVPADELYLYLFSATCAEVVEEAVALAGLTHARVSEVVKS